MIALYPVHISQRFVGAPLAAVGFHFAPGPVPGIAASFRAACLVGAIAPTPSWFARADRCGGAAEAASQQQDAFHARELRTRTIKISVLPATRTRKEDKNNLPYGAPHVREEHLVGPSSSGPLDDRPLFQARRPPLHWCLFRRPLHLRDGPIGISRFIEGPVAGDAGRSQFRFAEERHIGTHRVVF